MDHNRRKFLKVILIGGGTLIIEKILSPLFAKSWGNFSLEKKVARQDDHSPFRIFENEQILSIFDDSGVEVFQIDKRG